MLTERGRPTTKLQVHHIMLSSLKGRLKGKSCPLLLLSWVAFLHHDVLHPAKCSSPESNTLLFVFFFSLEHYFSTDKLVTRLSTASAIHSLATSLPILLKKKIMYLSPRFSSIMKAFPGRCERCQVLVVCHMPLTPSCLGHHSKILVSNPSVGICSVTVAMFIMALSSLEVT